MHEFAEDFIRQVGLEFKFATDVIVEGGGVRSGHVGHQRIVFGSIGHAQPVAAQEAAVEPAHGLARGRAAVP